MPKISGILVFSLYVCTKNDEPTTELYDVFFMVIRDHIEKSGLN